MRSRPVSSALGITSEFSRGQLRRPPFPRSTRRRPWSSYSAIASSKTIRGRCTRSRLRFRHAGRGSGPCPHLRTHLANRVVEREECHWRDHGERAIQGAVRTDRPEDPFLRPELFDIAAGFAAASEHQRGLHQDRASIVKRGPFTRPRELCRETRTEPEPIRERAQRMQPACATTCVPPASTTTRRVLLPFTCQVLLLASFSMLRNTENALRKGHLSRWTTPTSQNP